MTYSSKNSGDNPESDIPDSLPKIFEELSEKLSEQERAKYQMLNPRSSFSGDFSPANLLMDANLQEFANRTGIICALENGGKISPQDAYEQIKSLWAELSRSKNDLFGKGE
jgi:hypothetical protein